MCILNFSSYHCSYLTGNSIEIVKTLSSASFVDDDCYQQGDSAVRFHNTWSLDYIILCNRYVIFLLLA